MDTSMRSGVSIHPSSQKGDRWRNLPFDWPQTSPFPYSNIPAEAGEPHCGSVTRSRGGGTGMGIVHRESDRLLCFGEVIFDAAIALPDEARRLATLAAVKHTRALLGAIVRPGCQLVHRG